MKGFIDLQVNGFQGRSFSTTGLTLDDVREVTREIVTRGTAAYCPTVVTAAPEVFEENLPILARAMEEPDLAPHLLGIHIEGPFLAPEGKGAHNPDWMSLPDTALFDRWQELSGGQVKILTLAPELKGAVQLIGHVTGAGVVVSYGHHLADGESIRRGVEAGATACTHLGNGIANMLPRHPNPLWHQLAEDRLCCMLITDGHHLPPELIKVAARAKTVDRFIVVSDVAPTAGLPPGDYDQHGFAVTLEPSGLLRLKDGTALAGSSATMLECMNHLASLDLFTEAELRQVSIDNPLALIGADPPVHQPGAPTIEYRGGRFELVAG